MPVADPHETCNCSYVSTNLHFFVSGYVTNQHIHPVAHVPLQQNSPTKAAAPQPTDATANAESEQELDHEHSPV